MDVNSIEDIKKNPDMISLINKYNITDETLIKNSKVISSFLKDYVFCKSNEPLVNCKQLMKGVQQKLIYKNKIFYITSKKCNHWLYENKFYKFDENILYCDYDKKSIRITLGDYVKTINETPKNLTVLNFLEKFKKTIDTSDWKGFYLHGAPGVGKTYLLKLVANTMAGLDKKVIFVSVNKLIKIIKDTFNNTFANERNNFFDKCCDVDVLILDDIGGEVVSDWSRDELLFGILNYRMENKLTTHFSSNFSIKELEDNYLNQKLKTSDQKSFDKIKTLRFTERIKGSAYAVNIKGSNKRY
ncbi:primosomal protein DnaI [Spiroplasma litorale]|uniref:Primosomal protein DnaI n=1 Tax=Spiroplasma litorale TaxID=216942 RepID=A0A0K1W0X4_9MOLU|nr:DnaA/Hda family protein [Spiroplasma litorale]AKX33831.1 primosomal protein DnaI [Spiroplasma litorale]